MNPAPCSDQQTMSVRGEHRGFSMIELVIVIAIIAVIAAIAVPRMSTAADQSRARSLQSTTRTLQQAVDTYAAEHDGRSPAGDENGNVQMDSDALLKRLLARTNESGDVTDDGPFGPYLKAAPTNPFAKCNVIRIDTDAKPQGCAFRYDPDSNWVRPDNDIWSGVAEHFMAH